MRTFASALGFVLAVSAGGAFAADNALTPKEKADGWVLLFDGKTLNGWTSATTPGGGRRGGADAKGGAPKKGRGAPDPGAAAQVGSNPKVCSTPMGQAETPAGASHWEVVDRMIEPCGDPAGYLTTTANYKDFVLDVDFRTGADTNSGVFLRTGYEVQIWYKQPAGYNTGSIVGTGLTDKQYDFVADQWNHFELTADGDHLIVVLNGVKTLDVHDSKFADGSIRLQYQKFPIEFKNFKLKPITH